MFVKYYLRRKIKCSYDVSNILNIDEHISKVETFLDNATKGLDSDTLLWLKQQFEENMGNFIENCSGGLKVTMVLDANIAISTIQRYDSNKNSILHHLKDNPMFTIIAPPLIEEEVIKFIDSPEQAKSRTKLRKEWKRLKKTIQIKEVTDKRILEAALKITSRRDPKDSQYVALYIETNSNAILTKDDDFNDFSVRKFDITNLDKVVGTFHRGVYSFFIFHDAFPLVFELSGKIIAAILKNAISFLALILSLVTNAVTKSFEKLIDLFSKMSKGTQQAIGALLLIGSIVSIIILVLREDVREKASKKLSSLTKKAKEIIEKILEWITRSFEILRTYAGKAAPYGITSLEIIAEIQEHIDAISDELKNISTDPASYA